MAHHKTSTWIIVLIWFYLDCTGFVMLPSTVLYWTVELYKCPASLIPQKKPTHPKIKVISKPIENKNVSFRTRELQ